MENSAADNKETLSPEQAAAKAAILTEREKLANAWDSNLAFLMEISAS